VYLLSQFRDISVIVFVSDKSICETIHVLLKDLGILLRIISILLKFRHVSGAHSFNDETI
jgi:hypothetical protein